MHNAQFHIYQLQDSGRELEAMNSKGEHDFAGHEQHIPTTGTLIFQSLVSAIAPGNASGGSTGTAGAAAGAGTGGGVAALVQAARAAAAAEEASTAGATADDPEAPIDTRSALLAAQAHSTALQAAAEEKQKKKAHMTSSKPVKQYAVAKKLTQRELDEQKIAKAKRSFRVAGVGSHIRKGVDDDLAYLAPTLIPVPGAFQSDGSNPSISHVAENTFFDIKNSMILGETGYAPQHMLPLYQRNTLMEMNGVSSGGDQNYLVMAADRRYSHYVGRALNRFDPEAADNSNIDIEALSRGHTSTMFLEKQKKEKLLRQGGGNGAAAGGNASMAGKALPPLNIQNLNAVVQSGESLYGGGSTISSLADLSSVQRYSPTKAIKNGDSGKEKSGRAGAAVSALDSTIRTDKVAAAAAEQAAAARALRHEKRQLAREKEAGKGQAMTNSMVRMAFGASLPSLADLKYIEEMDDEF